LKGERFFKKNAAGLPRHLLTGLPFETSPKWTKRFFALLRPIENPKKQRQASSFCEQKEAKRLFIHLIPSGGGAGGRCVETCKWTKVFLVLFFQKKNCFLPATCLPATRRASKAGGCVEIGMGGGRLRVNR
jgi:hypothetical protein